MELASVVDEMRMKFGFPRIRADMILHRMDEINEWLQSNLGRKLPVLVQS